MKTKDVYLLCPCCYEELDEIRDGYGCTLCGRTYRFLCIDGVLELREDALSVL